jgi:hypothetical protein
VDTPDADQRRGIRGGPDLRRAVVAPLGATVPATS